MAYPSMHHMHVHALEYLVHFRAYFSISALPCTHEDLSLFLSNSPNQACGYNSTRRWPSWAYSPNLSTESERKEEQKVKRCAGVYVLIRVTNKGGAGVRE